jgi:cobalt/nickel transport protein
VPYHFLARLPLDAAGKIPKSKILPLINLSRPRTSAMSDMCIFSVIDTVKNTRIIFYDIRNTNIGRRKDGKSMRRYRKLCASLVLALAVFICNPAFAHFQVILPSDAIVSQKGSRTVSLDLQFTHPFEQYPMNMERPSSFGVLVRGEKKDLLGSLEEYAPAEGLKAWKADYDISRPGDHVFYVEPVPYWEAAEQTFIIHYTKTVVNAFGMEKGWDEQVGLRAEIIPLTRPYGLWEGNLFRGRVLIDGKPVQNADVEVEYFNRDKRAKAPSGPFVAQVVRTDDLGVFAYSIPWAGWWGFAALTEAPETMTGPEGEEVPIELGAVIWVHAEETR